MSDVDSPDRRLATRNLLFKAPVAVLSTLVRALPVAAPAELVNAARLLKSTCSVVASGLATHGLMLCSLRDDGSISCRPLDDSSAATAAKALVHCLVDAYELLVPLLFALLAVHGHQDEQLLRGICRSCQASVFALIDAVALRQRADSSSTATGTGVAFITDFLQYEAGSELRVRPEEFPALYATTGSSGAAQLHLHARGTLSLDVFSHYRVLDRLQALAVPAAGSSGDELLASRVDFLRGALEQRQRRVLSASSSSGGTAGGPSRTLLPGVPASTASVGSSSSVAAVLDVLPGLRREDVVAALEAAGGDVAGAVERLLAGAGQQAPALVASEPLARVPRRGDAVGALDPALKAATLRRAADIAVGDAAAAAAAAEGQGPAPTPQASAAAAALVARGSALLYEDEWDDAYDDPEHMDVPDQPAGSDDDAATGPGLWSLQPRSGRGGGDGAAAARGGGVGRGHSGGGVHSGAGSSPQGASGAVPNLDSGGSPSADGDRASDAPSGRGRGRGRGGAAGAVVAGHGPRARGGLTGQEAARRRELKARVGNHNRKRGADRKMAAAAGRGGTAAPEPRG